MSKVQISFRDSPTRQIIEDVTCVVFAASCVEIYDAHGTRWAYPWCNIHRVKEFPVDRGVSGDTKS